ncbi:hypothetical protein L0B52_04355 [Suttonella sp. R2A3]|uniref:putative nucleotidyltransferase substrate binding domain-containing protein n=1 Tax=Suttonella sp. R2A3 TaxID=2908648 RepID=UPI001F47FA64|nr:putative nucleotidyltransferase substrate binding domain-containing protein [Suttonella sp. R2A3]UJF25385.1 hypothetical protein L0B52_04355 [Suttonella sp. R2A3]
MMHLSTFLDARAVCGKTELLDELNAHVHAERQHAPTGLINHFAKAALQFGDSQSWWQKFLPGGESNTLNMKKAGIFPIVHGVRAMAFELGVSATSTRERLHALVQANVMDASRAQNLTEALDFFMAQRLKTALEASSKGERKSVNPMTMSALERDVLKECLNIVKEFKASLSNRYHLGMF